MSGRRKKDSGGGHGGEEAWLLPYADMITLLLGLFIVLFALSSIDAAKFDSVSKAFSQTFRGQLLENPGGIAPGSSGVLNAQATSAQTQQAIITNEAAASARTTAKFDREKQKLEAMAAKMNGSLKNNVKISTDERGIVIRVAGDALFESGEYRLKDPAKAQLEALAAELKAFNHEMEIEGHTDGAPAGGEFDNWGLSSDRALSVRQLFERRGVPRKLMSTLAKADTEPVVPPKFPTESVKQNRRVEIHILAPGKSDTQYTPAEERKALTTKKPTIAESVAHDHAVAAKNHAAGAEQATPAAKEPAHAPEPTPDWGGTSTAKPEESHGADLVAPIVEASH